jgi:hypothetical protein
VKVQGTTAGYAASAPATWSQRDTRVTARKLLRPGWPLAVLFYGFPLWWALGLAHFFFFVAAVPMGIDLLRRTPVRAPRWFGIWLVFLVWVLFGTITLWTHAPGTQYGGGVGRLINFGINYMWYATATIALLYIYNLRESELSTERIQRMVGWMFVVTALFGLAGTVDPSFQFKSLMEYVMPKGISHADFIHAMIHPQLASASDLLGYEQPRPIAPFMYANAWGNNLALFAPMFIASWFGGKARWRAYAGVAVLFVAAIPIIHSLNRGMWIGLSLALVYTVVRFAIAGRTRPLNLLIVALVIGTIGFMASPLYDTVTARFEHPHSNQRRGNLASEVVSTALHSPVIGYGGTRAKQGGYASIASADSSRCGSCGAPSLGTQGYLWLLLLGSGYVGAAMCLLFLLSHFLSSIRGVDSTSMVASVSILMSLVFFLIYDSLGSALVTLMLAIACHARAREQPHLAVTSPPRGRTRRRRGRDLADYVAIVKRSRLVLVAMTILGAVVGGGLAVTSPTSYAARTTVLMSRAPSYVDTQGLNEPPSVTIDTDAQLYLAPRVAHEVSARTDVPSRDVASRLLITAEPLTRVLSVTFEGRTPAVAKEGAETASRAMLAERQRVIVSQSTRKLNRIRLNLARLQHEEQTLQLEGKGSGAFAAKLTERIQVLEALSAQLQDVDRSAGRIIVTAKVVRTERGRSLTIWAGSGAGLGFLCALAIAALRRPRRPRGKRAIPRVWEVPLLRAR